MDIDFSLVLAVLVGVSGAICLYDVMLLASKRSQAVERYMLANELSNASSGSSADSSSKRDIDSSENGEAIRLLSREPVTVEYAKSFFPVLLLVLVLRSFLVEPFQIPSGSMIPTLEVGDFILVNKNTYGIRLPVVGTKIFDRNEPQRGDVMVFFPPHDSRYFIKRIIGLPGDHVRYENKRVYINGERVGEKFVAQFPPVGPHTALYEEQVGEVKHTIHKNFVQQVYRMDYWMQPGGRVIPEGLYFMMGDNRDNSTDSRFIDAIPETYLVGEAVRIWMHMDGFTWPDWGRVGTKIQ